MSRAWAPLSLLLVSFLAFANAIDHPFVHDDVVFIVQNPGINRLDDLPKVFYHPAEHSASGINTYYRPLLEVLYRLEYRLFGFDARGWHAFNILLHGINGVLVWRLLTLLGFNAVLSWATALLFILHPAQVEAVACVAGISNLLMAFFVLSALVFYTQDRWTLGAICFALGLLAKEQALMAVPLALLIDRYRYRKQPVVWFVFIALALGFLAARQAATGANLLADVLASPGELKLRLLAVAQVLATDVRLLILPYDLHYYRSTDILSVDLLWWPVVLLTGALVMRSPRDIRLGAFWFLFALLPVLNIVPLINEYSFILTAEHFLYVPMAGAALVVALLGQRLFKDKFMWALLVAAVVLTVLTVRQNTFWRSETALFERTMAYEGKFGRGHLLLAKAYYFEHNYEKANEHFAQAYAIMKGYADKTVGRPKLFYQGFVEEILSDWGQSLREYKAVPKTP